MIDKKQRNRFWQNFLKKNFLLFIKYYSHIRYSINCPFPDYYSPNNIQFNLTYAIDNYNYLTKRFPFVTKQIDRLLNNHYHKKKRVKIRLDDFINSSELVYFGTLTFTNDVLDNTSDVTRRKYVRRFLKENCVKYVANRDFGDTTNREHYHTAFICKNVDFFSNWKCGFVNVKQVWSINDYNALAEYIVKLANHSVKNTTDSVIYCRG